jgi:ribosomal protein S18 acetylase RimI-like enzyme
MSLDSDLRIDLLKGKDRSSLEPILEKSFEGWYLWHSKRTLMNIDEVYSAKMGEENVGLVMLEMLDKKTGYVYYIAVPPEHRGQKIASRLVDFSMKRFQDEGAEIVFASVSEDNAESNALFKTHGFRPTNYGEVSKKYGKLGAINMYRKMVIVSGEILLEKEIGPSLNSF